MYKKISTSFLFILLILPVFSKAQLSKPNFERGMFTAKGDTLPYRILFPENFDPQKKYPLIVVLHGAGERGNDNQSQLKNGSALFLKPDVREQFPAIVIFPQCPANGFWSDAIVQPDSSGYKFTFQTDGKPTQAMSALMAMVDEFLDKPFVNKHQVYIGGLSMGGMGTFEIIGREPNVFAAAFAICGGDNTLNAKKYAKKVPLWIFHGAKDKTVSADHSIVMVDAIKAAGGEPKFTLYPNDDHDSWDDAFNEPQLLPWLFSHSK
ncbi:MAG: prolyl oligopeptidase family serine peptidase [Sphingobacteriales bacterium]